MNFFNNYPNLYEMLFGEQTQDVDFYRYFIEKHNNKPALEIGSGTGRLLFEFLKQNLNVEALEPCKEMIEYSLQKAKTLNLNPTIYQQSLQNLKLDKQYNLIYMPLFVFQNIINRNDAIESLKLAYNHLAINGEILISIFMPWNDPTGTWENIWRLSKEVEKDSSYFALNESVSFDNFNQLETKQLKLEVFNNNVLEKTYFSIIKFRTYSRFELQDLLEKAGFKNVKVYGDYSLEEAFTGTHTFLFNGTK